MAKLFPARRVRRTDALPARGQERGVFAEEDGPIEGRVAHRGGDRSGRRWHEWVAERLQPGLDPARPEPARVLGEGDHGSPRRVESQPTEARDAGPGLGSQPADALRGKDRVDPVVRGGHDDLERRRHATSRQAPGLGFLGSPWPSALPPRPPPQGGGGFSAPLAGEGRGGG